MISGKAQEIYLISYTETHTSKTHKIYWLFSQPQLPLATLYVQVMRWPRVTKPITVVKPDARDTGQCTLGFLKSL